MQNSCKFHSPQVVSMLYGLPLGCHNASFWFDQSIKGKGSFDFTLFFIQVVCLP